MSFVSDSFTDTGGTALTSHTGETGATWAHQPGDGLGGAAQITAAGRLRGGAGDGGFFYASGAPASADYDVEGVLRPLDTFDCVCQVGGRMDAAANTGYFFGYNTFAAAWQLRKFVGGTETVLDTHAGDNTVGTDYTAKLEMRGSTITCYINGVSVISVTDGSITAAGKAGVVVYDSGGDATAWQIDSLTATDPVAGGTNRNYIWLP